MNGSGVTPVVAEASVNAKRPDDDGSDAAGLAQ
jgi:hypothetical protein